MRYKSAATAATKTHQLNMYNIMSGRMNHERLGWCNIEVEDIDIESLWNLLGTKSIGHTQLRHWILHTKPIGLYERIIYENGRWSYVGGQDYSHEMRYLKHLIRKG